MTAIAVTIWEGMPETRENLIERSKYSDPIHEKMGVKKPRLWRAISVVGIKRTDGKSFFSKRFTSRL